MEVVSAGSAPCHEAQRPGDIRHSLADLTRPQEALGYNPRTDVRRGLGRARDYSATLNETVLAGEQEQEAAS